MDVKALYELQKVDTAIEQTKVALEKLPERTHHAQALADLAHVRSTRDNLRREQSTMEAELASIETKSAEIDTHRAKLERQMKTIIAPREAEALQHEMQTLAAARNELDDRGLLLLESSASADEELRQLVDTESRAIEVASTTKHAQDVAVAFKNEEMAALQARRNEVIAPIAADDVATYDRLRASYKGIAVAIIQHGVCGGCHMDISVSELDAMKRLPTDQVAECPNCNRLLVR
ncbi:MAG: C4-type zinc ribbon domain-containing protein [Actinomycetota bacterium]|nr:C4-type zinc ribbon domain-containing protein [Actinomycetota bacterium]MDA3019381.1 C4-type zinc ribbon domain-containing protein [Actinomycetota bacterium]